MELAPGPADSPPAYNPVVFLEDIDFSRDDHGTPALAKIGAALAKAQAEIGHAKADSTNPHFSSRYADLASVIDACREPLAKFGIARWQAVCSRGAGNTSEVGVRTLLMCEGEFLANVVWCRIEKITPQALGSVITYLRRYALAAAVGIAQADDDAEASEGRTAPPGASQRAQRPSRPLPAAMPTPSPEITMAPIRFADPPALIPAGEAPVYQLRERQWHHVGFDVAITEKQQATIKILQKELGISQAEWVPKLETYYGKKSSTALTLKEASDCIERLESRKRVQTGA
jgi:hypothetical protein